MFLYPSIFVFFTYSFVMKGFYYGHSGCVEILTTLFDFLELICYVMVCYETSQGPGLNICTIC